MTPYRLTQIILGSNDIGGHRLAFSEQKNEMIRKDLSDEALHCAVTIGIRKTSVEQLTETAGLANGSFPRFFAFKELLFFVVLENIRTKPILWPKTPH